MMLSILEAALRSLLMALAVWGAMRLLRVQAVLAQKVAWVLVLLGAALMPIAMRSRLLALDGIGFQGLRIPIRSFGGDRRIAPVSNIPTRRVTSALVPTRNAGTVQVAPAPKPYPARLSVISSLSNSRPSSRTPKMPSAPTPRPFAALTNAPSRAASSPVTLTERFWKWTTVKFAFAVLYLVVAGILLFRTFIGLGIAFRIWSRSIPIPPAFGDAALRAPGKTPRTRVSSELSTPVTIGCTVILPLEYAQWDQAKLRIVLAHERSHVRQRDFYLQLLAAVHVAIFWFSPLGWWLQRKLSELGEALSDRAGMEQARNPASYAQVLLEFAAMPRPTVFAGVAMARSSNLSSRIDRVLNGRLFRRAFLGGRRHAFLSALLVPAALVAVVACIRIVPAVEAAGAQAPPLTLVSGQTSSPASSQLSGPSSSDVQVHVASGTTGQITGDMPEQVISVETGNSSDRVLRIGEQVPPPPRSVSPDPQEIQAPEPLDPPIQNQSYSISSDEGNSYAIVHENSDKTIRMSGTYNNQFAKVRKGLHGNYLWFERDGKSYVITDPAILAQADGFFKGNEELQRAQSELDRKQAVLNLKMVALAPEKIVIKIDTPEFKAQMARLKTQLNELDKIKIKEMSDKVTAETLADLQNKMGDIQGQIGEIQSRIGEQQGIMGQKQGEIGEQMGKLGEEMGKIGEQQGRIAEEADRRMKSMIDQAIKDGKARPVD